MILLEKPYVSPILAKTLAALGVPAVKPVDLNVPFQDEINWKTEQAFFTQYQQNGGPLLTNSENAIEALERHLPDHSLVQQISIFKNKAKFRAWLTQMYPHFYYRECSLAELLELSPSTLPFPLIVKPSVGYASLGVYRVANETVWASTCRQMERDMIEARHLYPESVLDTSHFLIEEWIEGEEYAVDAYYSASGEPVVVNVFKRMFSHAGDTSDRIYYTSKQVVAEALEQVTRFLRKLGETGDFRLFPLHLEVRISDAGKLVPIEINPLRFAGIGTTDLGTFAYGHNVYELFFQQLKPDWERVLSGDDERVYSFFCAELPVSLNTNKIAGIDETTFRSQFSRILEYRPMNQYDPTTFAVVFYQSDDLEENKRLLQLDLEQFVQRKELIHT